MTPLPSLRLWLRRAAPVEKRSAATAVVIVLALVAWALVPTNRDQGVDALTTAGGTGPTAAKPNVATDTTSPTSTPSAATGTETSVAPPGDGSSGAVPAAATSTTAETCGSKGATDQGVTASTVLVAIALVDIQGAVGNTAFKIRSDMKEIAEAVADDLNKTGGLKCRKIVTKFYKANPLDQNQLHATCLQIVQDKPFVVFDGGGFSLQRTCMAQYKIPVFSLNNLFQEEVTKYFPYMFSLMPTVRQTMRDYVFGTKDQGLFDPAKGFKKLGVLRETCLEADAYETVYKLLAQIGISGDKLTTFDMNCGSGASPPGPDVVAQAVLHMKNAGATHLFPMIDPIALNSFTQIAQQQLYRPRYASSDYFSQVGSEGSVNAEQFDGTIGVTSTRTGQDPAEYTDPATRRCNKIMTDHGLRPYVKAPDDVMVGWFCNIFWMLQAATIKLPALERVRLVNGLESAGPVAFSAPAFDAVFNKAGQVTAGTSVRPVQWHKNCTCWRVLTTDVRPEY